MCSFRGRLFLIRCRPGANPAATRTAGSSHHKSPFRKRDSRLWYRFSWTSNRHQLQLYGQILRYDQSPAFFSQGFSQAQLAILERKAVQDDAAAQISREELAAEASQLTAALNLRIETAESKIAEKEAAYVAVELAFSKEQSSRESAEQQLNRALQDTAQQLEEQQNTLKSEKVQSGFLCVRAQLGGGS